MALAIISFLSGGWKLDRSIPVNANASSRFASNPKRELWKNRDRARRNTGLKIRSVIQDKQEEPIITLEHQAGQSNNHFVPDRKAITVPSFSSNSDWK
jgi:hypothetical protein